jgi:hypothetical protein
VTLDEAFARMEETINRVPETVQLDIRIIYPGSGDAAVVVVELGGILECREIAGAEGETIQDALVQCAKRVDAYLAFAPGGAEGRTAVKEERA